MNKHHHKMINVLTVFIVTIGCVIGLLDVLKANAWVPIVAPTTDVGGVIITDTTWTLAGSPYVLTDTVTVATGVTLTVEPGVIVMGNSETFLTIAGHLEAVGTALQPITFTSSADSGAGEWNGLDFYRGTGNLLNIVVRYAGQYGGAAIIIDGLPSDGVVTIEDSMIRNNFDYSLVIFADNLHRLQMSNVLFADNVKNRVHILTEDYGGGGLLQLTDNVTLSSQPGLEGYEISLYCLEVPAGITLTLQAGTTIVASEQFEQFYGPICVAEQGHLEAVGTAVSPVTFTSLVNSGLGDWLGIFLEGSAHLNYTRFENGRINIDIQGATGGDVLIENSLISDSAAYGMIVGVKALHRLQLSNNTFEGSNRRILIGYDIDHDNPTLTADATLSAQTGLQSYEIETDYGHPPPVEQLLKIPQGVTLTMEAGITVTSSAIGKIIVEGHLETMGTAVSPVIFTSITNTAPSEWVGMIISGTATLENTHVRYAQQNLTIADGGQVVLHNSQVSQSGDNGIHNSGAVTMINSTLFDNALNNPSGGIYNNNGTLHITNSTLSGNKGGGIAGTGIVTATNSTFYANEGGLSNDGATYLNATIFEEAPAWDNCNITGLFIDSGYNLSSDNTCDFSGIGSRNDVSTLNLDILDDNGGSTLTHALLPNSAALDRIPPENCMVMTDQRGVKRPFNTNCDSGAFESTDVISVTIYLPLILK